MNRRKFVLSGGAVMAAVPAAAADANPSIIELTTYKLRNTPDMMPRRATDFVSQAVVPAVRRAGAAPIGVFQSVVAQDSPFIMTMVGFPDLAGYEAAIRKLGADTELAKQREAFDKEGMPYLRFESSLLAAFPSFTKIEVPAALSGNKTRIYELRTYESNSVSTLMRKIQMFGAGEIDIFRKVGMAPVFFGATLVGRNMPNLTYMVGFEDLAARDRIWGAFGSSPEWKKMSSMPEYADAQIVSNISNMILRPVAGSDIR